MTVCGSTSLTEAGCCLGGADSAVAVMLVLDEELLLLFAYDMDDGNNQMLVLRCEREPIEDMYFNGDIDEWDAFGENSTFPHADEYVGFGTGCAELLQGYCVAYLEDLFESNEVVAASPVLDVGRYDDLEDFCIAPRGSHDGCKYADVSYLVLQGELDARTEDAPCANEEEKYACVKYNGILLAAYSMLMHDLRQNLEGEADVLEEEAEADVLPSMLLPPPGELGRRARGRARYPHVLLRELVQDGRARLRHPITRGRLCPPSCKAHGPTDALLRFVYIACAREIFEGILRHLQPQGRVHVDGGQGVGQERDDAEEDEENEEDEDDEDDEDEA